MKISAEMSVQKAKPCCAWASIHLLSSQSTHGYSQLARVIPSQERAHSKASPALSQDSLQQNIHDKTEPSKQAEISTSEARIRRGCCSTWECKFRLGGSACGWHCKPCLSARLEDPEAFGQSWSASGGLGLVLNSTVMSLSASGVLSFIFEYMEHIEP